MSNNLQYQFKAAVEYGFKERMDKHSIKAELGNNKSDKVFSYKARKSLIQTGAQFAKYIKQNYPNVKYIKDILPEHAEGFLKDSIVRGCSNDTVRQYMARMGKLAILAEKKYHVEVAYMNGIKVLLDLSKGKVRDKTFSREEFDLIMEHSKNSKSYSRIGLKIAEITGARAEEITNIRIKDIDIENAIIHIHNGKGKRSRDIPIKKKYIEYVVKLVTGRNQEQKILPIRPNSLNQYLARQCEYLGIRQYKESKTGIHAIRKMYATEAYNERRRSGMSHQEAWGEVSTILGHGRDRIDLFNVYVMELTQEIDFRKNHFLC